MGPTTAPAIHALDLLGSGIGVGVGVAVTEAVEVAGVDRPVGLDDTKGMVSYQLIPLQMILGYAYTQERKPQWQHMARLGSSSILSSEHRN